MEKLAIIVALGFFCISASTFNIGLRFGKIKRSISEEIKRQPPESPELAEHFRLLLEVDLPKDQRLFFCYSGGGLLLGLIVLALALTFPQ